MGFSLLSPVVPPKNLCFSPKEQTDIFTILREMPESISRVIISVQSDTLSREILHSQAIVMLKIS